MAEQIANLDLSSPWLVALLILLVVVAVLAFVTLFAGITSWVERRIAGRMQVRIGPNRVGPQGSLQWLADGLKCFLKEDVIPEAVDPVLFRFAPYIVFMGLFGAFAVLPFGFGLIATDLNIGILFLLAITTLVVVGLLMAGWASNNKWSLIGGVRSTAQIVSYEIPTGLSIMAIVVLAGSLSTQTIIGAQGGWPWQWYIFHNPFAFVAFFIYFTSALAEGNRTPFDLPEAESELVAGYNTEYSGMRFLFFLFSEWANIWVMSAVATLLFFGGWQVPGFAVTDFTTASGGFSWPLVLVSVAIFFGKTSVGVFVVIWLRWTLPRLRVDQMMVMCWKYLTPGGFVCIIGCALWVLIPDHGAGHAFQVAVSGVLTAVGFALFFGMWWRALQNIRRADDEVVVKIWT